ncbi:MAG: hypothetical protein K9K67_15545 [Bacteriovoracaceae bacterium]|nr:hypothetical protein [Bacteriovoracaceae bacterium]
MQDRIDALKVRFPDMTPKTNTDWGLEQYRTFLAQVGYGALIDVNIAIIRIFTKLRSFLVLEKELVDRMSNLEQNTAEVFKVVFEKLDGLDEQLPTHRKNRTKIGLNNKD